LNQGNNKTNRLTAGSGLKYFGIVEYYGFRNFEYGVDTVKNDN
jgi:hypothetical protein